MPAGVFSFAVPGLVILFHLNFFLEVPAAKTATLGDLELLPLSLGSRVCPKYSCEGHFHFT